MKYSIKQYLEILRAVVLLVLIATNSLAERNVDLENRPSSHVIPDHYIVVLKQGHSPAAVAHTHRLNPHKIYSHALNGFAAAVPSGRLNALRNDPRVDFIEQDLQVFALGQVIPTGVQRIGATLSPAAKIDGLDERVNADIAIIDTGIDLTHPDLNVYR